MQSDSLDEIRSPIKKATEDALNQVLAMVQGKREVVSYSEVVAALQSKSFTKIVDDTTARLVQVFDYEAAQRRAQLEQAEREAYNCYLHAYACMLSNTMPERPERSDNPLLMAAIAFGCIDGRVALREPNRKSLLPQRALLETIRGLVEATK